MPPNLSVTANPTEIQNLVSGSRPEMWFSEVFRYAPMRVKSRAMMTLMVSDANNTRRREDPLFHFWQKPWNQRDAAVIDSFNDALATATSSASASGTTRYLQVTAANAKLFEVGQHVVVTKFNDSAYKQYVSEAKGRIEGKNVGSDTTSYLTIKLTQTDTDNALSGTYLRVNPGGQSHPNIHTLPESHLEQPTKYDGACSTFLGSYSMDDITRLTKLRLDYDMFTEAEADGLKDFAIDKEMGFIESVLDTSTNNHLCAGGLSYYLSNFGTSGYNIVNALTDTTYLSASTTGPAYTWIYEMLEGIVEYAARWMGNTRLKCYHGGLAGTVINQMIRDKGTYNLGETTKVDTYGFEFRALNFQNGGIDFYLHPLFTNAPRYQGTLVMLLPELCEQVTFMPFETIPADIMNGERQARAKRDGTTWSSVAKGGFRENCGWKFVGMDSMFIVRNVRPDLSRS